MLFGAADSTITPHSATISTWLLCECLQIKERWITCMSVNAAIVFSRTVSHWAGFVMGI